MLLLPQFTLQCENLIQVRADRAVEGKVVIKELVSDLLSQGSSANTALIQTVQYESFL